MSRDGASRFVPEVITLIRLLFALLATPFRSKLVLEAENSALRRQVLVLRRKPRGRVKLSNGDRLFFVSLYRLFPSIARTMLIIRPDTLVRWHRTLFRHYWRRRSRGRIGRRRIDRDLRALIRRMSVESVVWRAARIHGELVCTENVIRFDTMTNPVSVGGNDRADPPAVCNSGYAVPIQIGA